MNIVWPSFEANGICLDSKEEALDTKTRVIFEDIDRPNVKSGDITKITFSEDGDSLRFRGMRIAKHLRGLGIGTGLIEYFVENALDSGYQIGQTNTIHKPIIALTLSKAGFVPVSKECMAEILPRPYGQSVGAPKLTIVSGEIPEGAGADLPGGGALYEEVSSKESLRFPINSPEKTVALHTPYMLDA